MRLGSSWRWQLSRAMRLALRLRRLCRPQEGGGRVGVRLSAAWRYGKLLLRSLYYNSLTNSDTLLDCAFEPVYWIVDNVTRWFGVVFVCLVVLLTSSVVIIVYLFVLPTIFSSYPAHWIAWHLCCGHWLLILVVFHYYKATTTSPGHPPKDKRDVPSVSICKKCITPKPPRTHHCSICSLCVLKMDHHCPWLNNCVGHLNHRYFFSFCLYMTLGCIYCSISSRNLFLDAYSAIETSFQTPPPDVSPRESVGHKCIIFLWVLTSSVAVALGGLTLWHAKLISRGETSVERHINRKEARRLQGNGKVFRNPYHHGRLNNWKLFFGVETRRLRNKRGKEEERKKVRDKGRTEESRKEGRQRKREGRKRGVKKALDRGRKKKESDQKRKSLADPGPAALQPSAQRGRPHVGPALHQQRPHDHLTSLLPSHRTAEEELCSDAFWELNMTQLEMFWLLQIQALSHFDDF